MKIRRFLLFFGDDNCPYGGWHDLRGSYDTLQSARTVLLSCFYDWAHIVDLETGEEHLIREKE